MLSMYCRVVAVVRIYITYYEKSSTGVLYYTLTYIIYTEQKQQMQPLRQKSGLVLQTLQLTVLPCEYTTVHLSLELEALSRY